MIIISRGIFVQGVNGFEADCFKLGYYPTVKLGASKKKRQKIPSNFLILISRPQSSAHHAFSTLINFSQLPC